jgi:predicted ester cyclase
MPRDQFKMIAQASTVAFPDLKVTVYEQIAEWDYVVTRWSATGTHLGDFMGNSPTGKTVYIKAIHIHQVVAGRIAYLWEEIDLLGLTKELGVAIP